MFHKNIAYIIPYHMKYFFVLTTWMAVVSHIDRPMSVRNRCAIELFVALFVLSLCPFDISAGVGAFVIGLS